MGGKESHFNSHIIRAGISTCTVQCISTCTVLCIVYAFSRTIQFRLPNLEEGGKPWTL